jgi:hypothetical protein
MNLDLLAKMEMTVRGSIYLRLNHKLRVVRCQSHGHVMRLSITSGIFRGCGWGKGICIRIEEWFGWLEPSIERQCHLCGSQCTSAGVVRIVILCL